MAATAALVAHDHMLKVKAKVHVKGGTLKAPTVVSLLKVLHCTRDSVYIMGMSMRCSLGT